MHACIFCLGKCGSPINWPAPDLSKNLTLNPPCLSLSQELWLLAPSPSSRPTCVQNASAASRSGPIWWSTYISTSQTPVSSAPTAKSSSPVRASSRPTCCGSWAKRPTAAHCATTVQWRGMPSTATWPACMRIFPTSTQIPMPVLFAGRSSASARPLRSTSRATPQQLRPSRCPFAAFRRAVATRHPTARPS